MTIYTPSLGECIDRVKALEAENGNLRLELHDLWEFVRAYDKQMSASEGEHFNNYLVAVEDAADAREALRQYEESSDAPVN